MKARFLVYLVVLVALAILGGGTWYILTKSGVQARPAQYAYLNATADSIVVDSPQAGSTVGKSVTITGRARGPWYFEASFPVEVTDQNGEVIASTAAHAGGDWMTSEFVPFSATLTIPAAYVGPATIVLKNDNPSGDPSRAASLSYPVTVKY